jgi:2-pyrone-4,6-dicarboxylate lactonase
MMMATAGEKIYEWDKHPRMMVSNGNRDSKMDAGWGRRNSVWQSIHQGGTRSHHWGTDWPHPQWRKRMMNDAEEVELLYRYVDGDTTLRKILVENPTRLHGFKEYRLSPKM